MTTTIGSLPVSPVGVGCNSFGQWTDEASALAIVDAALEEGVTFFDTADYYGEGASEELLGRALRGRRDQAVIATKFGLWGGRPGRGRADREFVTRSLHASLRRLGTDHVDLYLLHFPDPDTPVEDTAEVLDQLVRDGLVREVGVCNVSADLLEQWMAAATPTMRVTAAQNEWSVLRRRIEADLLPACRRHDVAVIPYFPLANGLLTGKYRRGRPHPEDSRFAKAPHLADRYFTEANLDAVERLAAFAAERGRTLLELAISWLVGRPEVATVITGASKPDQVRSNVAAARWELTDDERAAVDALVPAPVG